MLSETDEKLVKKVQEGDILAFETLVKRYETKLLWFVDRILNNEADSQEVVQDTFFNVYKAIERIDTNRKFSSYLYRVAKNLAISRVRSRKKELSLREEIVGEDTTEKVYEVLAGQENRARIKKALSNLSLKYRRIVKLYYFKESTYKEIGRELGVPVNTVRTHLRRARGALRKVFKDE